MKSRVLPFILPPRIESYLAVIALYPALREPTAVGIRKAEYEDF